MNRTAVVFGATGLVGLELVRQLLADERYDRVVVVVRRLLPLAHPALEQILVTDYGELSRYAGQLEASVYFCCIGTTQRKTQDKVAYRGIDLGIPVQIAGMAASLGVPVLIVVSSIGASPRSTNFYLHTKGDMEQAVRAAYPGRLVFVRPSMLIGLRREFRLAERVACILMPAFDWLLQGKLSDYRSIRVNQVAAAMRQLVNLTQTDSIYQTRELKRLAKGLPPTPVQKTMSSRKKANGWLIALFCCLVGIAVLVGYRQHQKRLLLLGDLPEVTARGELRALTLYSSVSYFIYRDKEMGYEYELCSQLANSLGLKLKMITAPTTSALMDSLEAGVGDIIAFNVPLTSAIKARYIPCGREFLTHQVLVQRRDNPELVRDVTGLLGRKLIVQKGTPFHIRLRHLNEELGGGIVIQTISDDSLTTEDLIEQVATGQIEFTVADNVQAQFNKTFYKNLHVGTALGFPQHAYWLVRKESPELAAAVTHWFGQNVTTQAYKAINKRYFELSKGYPSSFLTTGLQVGPGGRLSPFDALFKQYAAAYSLDWRLLASIGYQESKYDSQVVSWAGAVGLMQIMPSTARAYGVEPSRLLDPEQSVIAACRLLSYLNRYYRSTTSVDDRTKLMLAAFNCGEMHVNDARALAKKYGKNPHSWEDVLHFLLLKRQPKYYQDPVCKQGYLRATETANFVTEVWTRYQYFISKGVKE